MDVTNLHEAEQYVAVWRAALYDYSKPLLDQHGKYGHGRLMSHFNYAAEGLRTSAAILRSYRSEDEAMARIEAAEYLERCAAEHAVMKAEQHACWEVQKRARAEAADAQHPGDW